MYLSTWPMVCFLILSTCLWRASSLTASSARVTLAARRLSFRSRVRKKLRKFSRSIRPSPFASNLQGCGREIRYTHNTMKTKEKIVFIIYTKVNVNVVKR